MNMLKEGESIQLEQVSFEGGFRVKVGVNGKIITLPGTFPTREQAKAAGYEHLNKLRQE
jgi:hypothetical protein